MTKDLAVTIRIRNGRLLRAMRAAGLLSMKELSETAGVGYSYIVNLANFRQKPVNQDGDFTMKAYSVAIACKTMPQEIWPKYLTEVKADKNCVEIDMTLDEARQITGDNPDRHMLIRETAGRLLSGAKTAASHNPYGQRNIAVLEGYLEGATKEELSHEFNVTSARVAQIIARQIRRFQHPAWLQGIDMTVLSEHPETQDRWRIKREKVEAEPEAKPKPKLKRKQPLKQPPKVHLNNSQAIKIAGEHLGIYANEYSAAYDTAFRVSPDKVLWPELALFIALIGVRKTFGIGQDKPTGDEIIIVQNKIDAAIKRWVHSEGKKT